MVLDSKSTTDINREENLFRKSIIAVAVFTAFSFSAAALLLQIVEPSEILLFSALVILTAVLAVEALTKSIRPHVHYPTLKMRKIQKKMMTINEEILKREKYLEDLQVTAYGIAKFVKQENIENVLSKIAGAVACENVNLWLSSGTDLVLAADWGINAKRPVSVRIPISEVSGATYTFKTGKTLISKNAKADKRLSKRLINFFTIRNLVCTPLVIGKDAIGVLAAVNKKVGAFTKFDIDYLKATAYPLASAIQNANLANDIDRKLEEERYFLTDLAHNLKTPLTTLRGELEVATRINETKEGLTKRIFHAISTLEQVSKVLEKSMRLAYYEMNSAEFLEFDIEKVARDVFEISYLVAKDKGVQLSFKTQGQVKIMGEEDKILQALLCILDNAVKYTPKGGKVDLALSTKDNMAQVVISDTGFGIANEDINSIFKRFWKGPKAEEDGIGLGLSIANTIIASHRGKINVKSEIGKGTKFSVYLPISNSLKSTKSYTSPAFKDSGEKLFPIRPSLNN